MDQHPETVTIFVPRVSRRDVRMTHDVIEPCGFLTVKLVTVKTGGQDCPPLGLRHARALLKVRKQIPAAWREFKVWFPGTRMRISLQHVGNWSVFPELHWCLRHGWELNDRFVRIRDWNERYVNQFSPTYFDDRECEVGRHPRACLRVLV
jgi:hypothetical protein